MVLRICRLYPLQRGQDPSYQKKQCPKYNIDSEETCLEVWRVWSTPLLLLLPGLLHPGELVSVRVPSIDQIDVWKLFLFHRSVCKKKNRKRESYKKKMKIWKYDKRYSLISWQNNPRRVGTLLKSINQSIKLVLIAITSTTTNTTSTTTTMMLQSSTLATTQ